MKDMRKMNEEFDELVKSGELEAGVGRREAGGTLAAPGAVVKSPATAGLLEGEKRHNILKTKKSDGSQNPCMAGLFPLEKEAVSPKTRQEIYTSGMEAGRFAGLNFARQVVTVAQIAILTEMKETKSYRESGYVNWESYCANVLHVNVDVIDEMMRNFKKFGPGVDMLLKRAKEPETAVTGLYEMPGAGNRGSGIGNRGRGVRG